MTRDQIRAIALANGFQLKRQPDGSDDLHPYVYAFAAALFHEAGWQPLGFVTAGAVKTLQWGLPVSTTISVRQMALDDVAILRRKRDA